MLRPELVRLAACDGALAWVGDRTREQAWTECVKGSWLAWYLEACGVDCTAAGAWALARARESLPSLDAVVAQQREELLFYAAQHCSTSRLMIHTVRTAWLVAEHGWKPILALSKTTSDAAVQLASVWAAQDVGLRAEAAEELAIANYIRSHYVLPEGPMHTQEMTNVQLRTSRDRTLDRLATCASEDRAVLVAVVAAIEAELAWRERAAAAAALDRAAHAQAGAVTCSVSRRTSHGPGPRPGPPPDAT